MEECRRRRSRKNLSIASSLHWRVTVVKQTLVLWWTAAGFETASENPRVAPHFQMLLSWPVAGGSGRANLAPARTQLSKRSIKTSRYDFGHPSLLPLPDCQKFAQPDRLSSRAFVVDLCLCTSHWWPCALALTCSAQISTGLSGLGWCPSVVI